MNYIANECDKNLNTRFFLHLKPIDNKQIPEQRQKHGFDNYDFNWADKEVATKNWLISDDVCLASIKLPNYPLRRISTGQFNSTGRLWQGSINLTKQQFKNSFQPYNLSDGNWTKGVSKTQAGLFIENNFENRQSLSLGNTLVFNKSGERIINSLSYSQKYINIFVSGELLDPKFDGYPHKFILKNSNQNLGEKNE